LKQLAAFLIAFDRGGSIPRSVLRIGELLLRHSRMLLAGIQANSDWTPNKTIRR